MKAQQPTRSRSTLVTVSVIVVLGLIIGGVTLSQRSSKMDMPMSGGVAAAPTDAVATDKVTISDYTYAPAAITVKAGTMVTWTNQDAVSHTVTSDSGSELASDLFGRSGTFTHTFTKAGTYTYHCMPHTYMKATVVVTN